MPLEQTPILKPYKNEGNNFLELNMGRHAIDYNRQFYVFPVEPIGAPRMTQSDKWKTNPHHPDPKKRQRPAVIQYFKFKNDIYLQSLALRFKLGDYLDAVYFIPMPASWSNKKKLAMLGTPCLSKPDTDNITKAIKDALLSNDSGVWYEKAEKRWAYNGSILIYK